MGQRNLTRVVCEEIYLVKKGGNSLQEIADEKQISYACLFIPSGSIELELVMFFASLFYDFATVKSSGLYSVIDSRFASSLLCDLILPLF